MFRKIKALIIKEFITTLSDKKSRFVLIITPLIQLLILSNAATLDVTNASLGILNRDFGKPAQEFCEGVSEGLQESAPGKSRSRYDGRKIRPLSCQRIVCGH